MFEVGKLTDESLDSFLSELEKVLHTILFLLIIIFEILEDQIKLNIPTFLL